MPLPDDLKHYKAPDSFQLISEEAAGALVGAALALLVLADIFWRWFP